MVFRFNVVSFLTTGQRVSGDSRSLISDFIRDFLPGLVPVILCLDLFNTASVKIPKSRFRGGTVVTDFAKALIGIVQGGSANNAFKVYIHRYGLRFVRFCSSNVPPGSNVIPYKRIKSRNVFIFSGRMQIFRFPYSAFP